MGLLLDGASLKVETPADELARKLRQVGYSDSAVEEILKWYKQNNTERRT